MSADLSSKAAYATRSRFAKESKDLEDWISEVPKGATVKGMYLSSMMASLDRGGYARPTKDKFVPFKDYPLTAYMRLMLDASALAWPNLPPREGLRSLGQGAYPTLAESMVGRVIFSVAGRSWKAALPLTEKAYGVSLSPGSAKLAHLTDHSAVLELRDIWNFADSYQVGVMEGAMVAFGVEGTVTARRRDRKCDVDLQLRWT
jgi:uncharacterized protein (TIGR02265 family)